jgi:hypothetical protein
MQTGVKISEVYGLKIATQRWDEVTIGNKKKSEGFLESLITKVSFLSPKRIYWRYSAAVIQITTK